MIGHISIMLNNPMKPANKIVNYFSKKNFSLPKNIGKLIIESCATLYFMSTM